MKPRSGRTIPLYFKVSPEEKEIIGQKMEQLGIHNQRAYLRKMAVDGYAVRVDMSDFKALVSLLRICSTLTRSQNGSTAPAICIRKMWPTCRSGMGNFGARSAPCWIR